MKKSKNKITPEKTKQKRLLGRKRKKLNEYIHYNNKRGRGISVKTA